MFQKKLVFGLEILVFINSATLLFSCAFITTSPYPLKLETAVTTLSDHLLTQLRQIRSEEKLTEETAIVLDPFVDADSGEVVNASRDIERIIFNHTQKNYPKYALNRINPVKLHEAEYVLNGTMQLDTYKAGWYETKYYRLSSALINLKNGKVITSASAWVTDALDYTPTALYKDRPLYFKDKYIDGLIETAGMPTGSTAQKDYYDTLPTHALLEEAASFYEDREYQMALKLFKKAKNRPDGQIAQTYTGLYESHYKLNQITEAEAAFAQLLKISVETNNSLNIRFLFIVDSIDFIDDSELHKQYKFWLRQLVKYFKENDKCVQIVGHCSRTGTSEYNNQLSLARARYVQQLLQADFPDIRLRSKALGKGFHKNLVGSGSDDARDAIDRRVEFSLVECDKLKH